jgi:hypothetical protein
MYGSICSPSISLRITFKLCGAVFSRLLERLVMPWISPFQERFFQSQNIVQGLSRSVQIDLYLRLAHLASEGKVNISTHNPCHVS